MKILAAIVILSLFPALALAEDCKAIQDATARLACFDKPPPKAATPKAKKAAAIDDFADAKAAIKRKLTDPESAQFTEMFKVQAQRGDAVCGLVNSKNRMGGYAGVAGFFYDRISRTGTIMFSGGSDPEYSGPQAAAYCVFCTTTGRGDPNIGDHCPGLIKAYWRPGT